MSVGEPHIIRLRGPWEYTLLAGPRAGETGRIDLSGDWHHELTGTGRLRLTRHFQAPTGITQATRVHLFLRNFPAELLVALDGQPLSTVGAESYDLTAFLARRHRLDLDLPDVTAAGEVWLEIREHG